MTHATLGRLTAIGILVGLTVGCSWFRGAPEAPARIAERMRQDPVPYERLLAAAGQGPGRNVLWLRETYLAELALGTTSETVRRRWGEPTRVRQTAAGTWWEYEEVYPKPGATPEPPPSDAPPDERREPTAARVGMNLRLLFVDPPSPSPLPTATPPPATVAPPAMPVTPPPATLAPATPAPMAIELVPAPEAVPSGEAVQAPTPPPALVTPNPTPTPAPPKLLAHIQAWSPARFQTRSLVRVLDPASRVVRKYGQAPQVLPWGREGGEVWLYPAANVGFVMTPAWEEQPRHVAATLVGF